MNILASSVPLMIPFVFEGIRYIVKKIEINLNKINNVSVSLNINTDGIFYLRFENTGDLQIRLNNVKINVEWVNSAKLIMPEFELPRINGSLNEMETVNVTLKTNQFKDFPLFRFFYSFKPWFYDQGHQLADGSYSRTHLIDEENNLLYERQKHLNAFFKTKLVVNFKASNFQSKNIYIDNNNSSVILNYINEIENNKFNYRGQRIPEK